MPTTSTSLFIKLLKENGMDAKTDVDMIQVAIGSEPGPFVAKQADVAVMYEPGLDQAVAKGMKVVLGFPKSYGAYAFSAVTARNDVDPDTAQRVVNGMEMAMRFMAKEQAKTVEIAKKEFPTLDPAVVEAAVKRMLADASIRPASTSRRCAEGRDGHPDRARFTTNVADAAYVLRLVAGTDAGDPHASHVPVTVAKAAGRRIGMLARQVGGAVDPAQQAALDALAERLARDGADIVIVDLPAEIFDTPRHALTLMGVEAAITHGELVDRSPELVSAPMRELVKQGRTLPAIDYARTKVLQERMAHRFERWIRETMALDALLVAPASGEPPRGLDSTGDASFCAPWTFLGVPAVTVPVGFGPAGLPLGAQLVGAANGDAELLELAEWVEERTGWKAAVAARPR
jgi:hypothetical protein